MCKVWEIMSALLLFQVYAGKFKLCKLLGQPRHGQAGSHQIGHRHFQSQAHVLGAFRAFECGFGRVTKVH